MRWESSFVLAIIIIINLMLARRLRNRDATDRSATVCAPVFWLLRVHSSPWQIDKK